MKILGVVTMSFISGLILSYVYFSMHNLRADVVSQFRAQAANRAPAAGEQSKSAKFIESSAVNEHKLQAPRFASHLPANLRTRTRSELKVEWDPVAGAKSYSVFVETKNGKSIRKYQTKNTFMMLRNLPLPESEDSVDYNVRLAAMSESNELSPKSEARSLEVDRGYSARPPTIKVIEVLD